MTPPAQLAESAGKVGAMEAASTIHTPLADEGEPLFGTETMAELCARQGRLADAIAIYRRLVRDGGDDRCVRWTRRLEALEILQRRGQPRSGARAGAPPPGSPEGGPTAPTDLGPHRLPVVVRLPVRSGQVVYAERNDLIVLAPVNPGAQLVADGNIHVYGPLRGRAIAGAAGCEEARLFCQRLEAELVGIGAAYLPFDELPVDRRGRPAQVSLRNGRCVVEPL